MYLNATPLDENWIPVLLPVLVLLPVALLCLINMEATEELESSELEVGFLVPIVESLMLEVKPSSNVVVPAIVEAAVVDAGLVVVVLTIVVVVSVVVVIVVVIVVVVVVVVVVMVVVVVVGAFSGFESITPIALLTPSMASKFSTRRVFLSCSDKVDPAPS